MAGIYIHIPFCRQACSYCNFYFSTSTKQKNDFITALLKEISLSSDFIPITAPIDTIYFGGGTPSLLSADELHSVLHALNQKFRVSRDAEITLEANPDDISPKALKDWMNEGINRLSVGIQSFQEDELRWMNRAHTAADSVKCIAEIREAGITDFSVDLIFGSSLLNDAGLEKNVQFIISQQVPHISCYALTVEPKTALARMIALNKTAPVDAEKQSDQFLLLMDLLQHAGYEHYEISNYALPGKRSRHNSSYWQGKPYFGFGPSAHSYDGKNRRRWNIANNALYIQQLKMGELPAEEGQLNLTQQTNEYIMTSLRTMEGLNPETITLKYA